MIQRLTLLLLIAFACQVAIASGRIIVLDKRLALSGNAYEHFFMGLYEGDTAIISFEELNEKEIGSVELYAYPSELIYSIDNQRQKSNQRIPISKSGVYYLQIKNTSLGKRAMEVRLERIPKDEESFEYSSDVKWKEVEDTSSIHKLMEQVYEKHYLTQTLLQPSYYYLNARQLDRENDHSKLLIPIHLPPNTVSWYYSFSTADKASDIKKAMRSCALESQLKDFLTVLDSVSNHELALHPAPGKEYCDFFLLDQKHASNFLNSDQFDYYTSGSSRYHKSGVIDIYDSEMANRYIGVRNPNEEYGIYFSIEVVAIIEEKRPITDFNTSRGVKRFKQVPFIEYQYE